MKITKKLLLPMLLFATVPLLANENQDPLGYEGYQSSKEAVYETLNRLKSDQSITISDSDGWTVATSASNNQIWSFTPKSHPAHPAYVKREVIEKNGSIYLDTTSKCAAEKVACDELVQSFLDLNKKIYNKFQK